MAAKKWSWLALFLAAVAGVLILLFGAGTASAALASTAQSRVAASTTLAPLVVEAHDGTGAAQQQGNDSATHKVKFATEVSARAGVRTVTVTVTGLTTIYDTSGSTYDGSTRLCIVDDAAQESSCADPRRSAGRSGRQTATRSPARSVSGFVVAAKTGLPQLSAGRSALQAKFKHASDFGITESRGSAGFDAYGKAVDRFVQASSTTRMLGTYRGNAAILNYNARTAQVVVQAPDGAFISGWQMSPAQLQNVIARGSLGGG